MAVKKAVIPESGIWVPVDFSNGTSRYWEFGNLRLWVRKAGREWQTCSDYADTITDTPVFGDMVDEPVEGGWNRYISGNESLLQMQPVLPDRPVIVRPEEPLKILSGAGAELYLYLPVWLEAGSLVEKDRRPLAEFPGERLSSSWFGDMKSGELCYSFREYLRPRPFSPAGVPWFAVCPLTIKNASQTTLDFQRFCLRCVHLTLYTGRDNLYTNEIQVRFSGEDQVSQVVFSSKPPDAGEPVQVIAKPRTPYSSNILKKSFGFLKTLTDM